MNSNPISTERALVKAGRNTWRYRRIKWSVFILGMATIAQLYDFQALLTQMSQAFDQTPSYSSYLVSSATVGMAMGLLIFAFIADHFKREQVMVGSAVSSTLLTLVMPLLSNFDVLIFLNFLKGLCISGTSAVTLAYLTEEVAVKSVGVVISFYLAGNTFGGMFGRFFTGLIGGWYNWQTAIFFVGISALLLTLVFLKMIPDARFFKPLKKPFSYQIKQGIILLKDRRLLSFYGIGFCLMGGFVSVYNYIGFRLEAAPFGLPHYVIAFIFLMYIFGITGNLWAGVLSDRYTPQKVVRVTLLVFVMGTGLLFSSVLGIVLLGLLLTTLAFFSSHTVVGRLVAEFASEQKAMATSLYWLSYYMGSSIVGTSSGFFVNAGLWNLFFMTISLLGLASLGMGYYSTKSR